MIFIYIALALCGVTCIGFTVYGYKRRIQKNEDALKYNREIEEERQALEQDLEKLKEEYKHHCDLASLLYEQLDDLDKDQMIARKIIKELDEQKQSLYMEVEIKKQEKQGLEAQMTTLNRSIEELSGSLKAAARASFEQYCDALDYQYQQKEQEFDTEVAILDQTYFNRMMELDAKERELLQEQHKDIDALKQLFYDKQESMSKELHEEEEKMRADLATIRTELEKIRATKAAAMEAQLREEEIKNQATFYTLQLNDADKRDIAYLQSIEYNLREARPLRMLIWSTFYRDKVNELAARVGAIGACGIYKLTHIESGISYIGQAKDIKDRWVTHVKCSLGIDTPVTSQLYAFTKEKGIDNFTFEILEKCNINELNEKEKFYIDLYQTYDFGLNKTRGNG